MKMKKAFLQSAGYNLLACIWGNKMVVIDCATIEESKEIDIEGVEGFDSVEEASINSGLNIYIFIPEEWEKITYLQEV